MPPRVRGRFPAIARVRFRVTVAARTRFGDPTIRRVKHLVCDSDVKHPLAGHPFGRDRNHLRRSRRRRRNGLDAAWWVMVLAAPKSAPDRAGRPRRWIDPHAEEPGPRIRWPSAPRRGPEGNGRSRAVVIVFTACWICMKRPSISRASGCVATNSLVGCLMPAATSWPWARNSSTPSSPRTTLAC